MNQVVAKFRVIFILMIFPILALAQIQSPAEFLGYQVGTKFTRHHQIVGYFNEVAKAAPSKVKLIPYGKTNEGRDLLVAAISSPENIAQLDNIRKHNIGITEGSVEDIMQPAIVWLSYNVHGNEPASSEAAMLTLFALVDPANKKSAEWLEHVVVMIDPCINPDGRDRYVNWYNNAVGVNAFNADQQAREHMEPWPAGRTNHFNFDLNRDWAWQTQVETQQRIPLYQQWYPQVHVDFHEQGYNEPYYFAPAAEPLHVLLTPWQKEFQDQIGKNHAKYFDQNNWLFFTKERFDLLYPSYGDTYPMYNGAIGMTYEQGGISAGLGVLDKNNDTLTLVARAKHHFTTGMSTVEISALNYQKLLNEFKKYYQNSRAGNNGNYQTYLMTSSNAHKIKALADLLKKNNIQFGTYNGNNGIKAFDYQTKAEGNFVNEGYTIAVSSAQPHGVLASVLLDPITQVNDSNTYDITAWSLPYAFGVHGFASKEKLAIQAGLKTPSYSIAATEYGYIIPHNSFATAKVLAQLLNKNIKVRYAEKAFTAAGRNFDKGSLLVLKTSNNANWATDTKSICEAAGVEAVAVSSGYAEKGADFGSPLDKMINHAPRVALLTGEGIAALAAGEVWNYFEQQLNYPVTQLTYTMLGRIDLNKYDVIIAPEGQYKDLNSKPIAEKFQAFVRKGGVLIAMESAALQFAANPDWGVKVKEAPTPAKTNINDLAKYGERVEDQLESSIPGAIYKVYIDDTHPLGYGTNGVLYNLKQDISLYEPSNESWNVGAIKKDSYVTGFVGNKAKAAIQEGVVIGVKDMGAGKFIYMADDPIFRNFWEAGKLILANAVFFNGK
jgi:Zinc carboxypeptidase